MLARCCGVKGRNRGEIYVSFKKQYPQYKESSILCQRVFQANRSEQNTTYSGPTPPVMAHFVSRPKKRRKIPAKPLTALHGYSTITPVVASGDPVEG
jgi:hypothetical protein